MEMLIIDRESGFECLVEKRWDLKKNLSELNYFLLSYDYHAFNYDYHTTLY